MLQKLNERIQGFVAWIVVILIAITFTLFGVEYYMQSRQTSDAEVTVNGEPISKQSFEVTYRRNRQQRDPSQLTAASESALKKEVLESMIVNQVTIQAAKNAGFEVSPEQANAAIKGIPQFQEDGRFSAEKYQQALSGAMFTPESFQKEVRQGMLLNQQRFAFMGSAFALPDEIKRFVKLYMQTRDYQYLVVPSKLFTASIQIHDTAVKAYYDQHQKEFMEPEQVSIEYVQLSMKAIRDAIKIDDKALQAYYDENQGNYLQPAKWHVAHILIGLPEGANEETQQQVKQKAQDAYLALQNNPLQFSEWVKTMSADKLSLAKDGELPWITAGSPFDKALSELTQPGQISRPFKTTNGYEIFKLIAYKPASLKPFAEVKQELLEQLSADRAQTNYAQALEQLTDLSYQTPDSLSSVAETMKLPIQKTGLFSREGGSSDITKNKLVVNTAFSHDVLDLSNNSEPVQLDNDSVIVLRVNQHVPVAEKPLDKVKNEIVSKLTQENARKEAQKLGLELLSTKAAQDNVEKLIQQHQLKWQSINNATRDADSSMAAVNELAFNLPRVNTLEGKSLDNGDYVIVRLVKINNGKYSALDKEQQASLAQQIESSYGIMDYDLYVNNRLAKAKIERH